MLTIRRNQLTELGEQTARRARRERVAALRGAGLAVREDPRAKDKFQLEDRAGGKASLRFLPDGVEVESGEGRALRFHYDSDRWLQKIRDAAGLETTFQYDEKHRLSGVRRGDLGSYRFGYDGAGNLSEIGYPDGTTARKKYDAAGRISRMVDGNGNARRFEYAWGHLPAQIIDARDGVTAFEYKENGEIESLTDAAGERQTYEPDPWDGGTLIRRNGRHIVTIHADAKAGTRDVFYPDGTEAHFRFEGKKLVWASNGESATTLQWDRNGCLAAEETDGQRVEYTRDALGNLIAVNAGKRRLLLRRDSDHRLRTVEDEEAKQSYAIDYDASGVPAGIRYPNGTSASRRSDIAGRPTHLTIATKAGDTSLAEIGWGYDLCDRVVTEEWRGRAGAGFRYDAEGRLQEVTSADPVLAESWQTDANGNRLSVKGEPWVFNATDQVMHGGEAAFQYDALGGQTLGVAARGRLECRYNGRGQLAECRAGSEEAAATYGYDALGRRRRKEYKGTVTEYVWAGQWLLGETATDERGKTARTDYVVAPDLGIALAYRAKGNSFCLHHGRRWEVLAATDARGRAVWQARYGAFGEAIVDPASEVKQSLRLAGQYYDEESGLHYNVARYYDPSSGRYLQRDPLGYESGSWNEYVYCGGDPLNYYDPSGEFLQILAGIGIGAAIGAAVGGGIEAYKQYKAGKGFDFGKIGKEALIGGAVGAVGGAVLMAAPMLVGALGGGLAASVAGFGIVGGIAGAIQTCLNASLHHQTVTPGDLFRSFETGAVIGMFTAGVGGLVAGRAGQALEEAGAGAKVGEGEAAEAAQQAKLPAPESTGEPVTSEAQPAGADPVNTVTGAVFVVKTDFSLPGALPLELTRVYSSQSTASGPFGPRWTSNWSQWVTGGRRQATFYGADGRWIRFDLPAEGGDEWISNADAGKFRLRRTAQGFEVRDGQRRILRFATRLRERWLLSSIEDPNGYSIRFTYDESGALRQILHSGGYRLLVEGTANRIRRVVLPGGDKGPVVLGEYEYDERERLAAVTDGSGLPFRYFYDDRTQLTKWQDRNGGWYEYEYDENGRCTKGAGPKGIYAYRFEYDERSRTNLSTDSGGNITRTVYNERRQIVEQTGPLGNTRRFRWDKQSNKLEERDAAGRGVWHEFDADGNPIAVHDALERVTRISYNALGLPETLTDAARNEWKRRYDERGNLVESEGPDGAVWHYERDRRANIIRVTDPLGNRREFGYDSRGLLMWSTDAKSNRTEFDRDAMGRVTLRRDPLKRETRFAYNALGKLAETQLPDGNRLRWEYDPEGNLARRIGADGKAYRYSYGAFDLLHEIEKPSGGKLKLNYDGEARLTSVVNELSQTWSYEYNAAGQVITERDFHGRLQKFEYDPSGLCIRRVNGADEEIGFEWDAAGQLTAQRGSEEAAFVYDEMGQVRVARNNSVEVALERDAYGRVLKEVQKGGTVESVYDRRGQRVKRVVAGKESEWAWDANGQAATLTLGGNDVIEFAHDAVGREVERRIGAGTVLRQQFDDMDRLKRQWVGPGTPAVAAGRGPVNAIVVERDYRYDANGDPIEILDARWGKSAFGYDPDGRIARADRQRFGVEEFTYDLAGNITATREAMAAAERGASKAKLGLTTRFYSKDGRLEKVGETQYEWDADGRLKEKREGTKRWRYEWTPEGRLRSVVRPDGKRWTYEYDSFGRRMAKNGPNGSVSYVWDGAVVAEEIAGEKPVEWIYEPGTFRPLVKREGANAWRCVTDQVGTPRELIGKDGSVGWSGLLSTWGEPEPGGEAKTGCGVRFQGQWLDEESGLHYNYKRYYDPSHGQYISQDLIGLLGGTQPYGYVGNPASWIDPLGLAGCAAAGNNGTTTLWRAVGPEELADIQGTNQFRNLGSAEGKYFSTSAEGAASYAKQAVSGFGDPPYTLVRTQVPTSQIPDPLIVDSNVPAVVLPDEALPALEPEILDFFPLP